ncbi:MAG: hypothetical protein V4736_07640 [Bdellovibrionota bacterium]
MRILKQLILLSAIFVSHFALAKKLLIYSDEPTGAKASMIRHLIQSTPPFSFLKKSELTIEVKILESGESKIDCHPMMIKYTDEQIKSLDYWSRQAGIILSEEEKKRYKKGFTIDRLTECDKAAMAQIALESQADRMIYIHASPYEGGSGGTIPVILSSSRPGIGLHEWLHTFGLADEYAYRKEEAPFYCQRRDWANVAIFNDAPPYANSEDVKARHQTQIPWLPYLSKTALLVTGDQLGSPQMGNLGIFRSATCNNVSPVLKSWKSSSYPTIMEDPFTNYIPKPYWRVILTGLGVSENRISELMQKNVVPTWLKDRTEGPGSPPPKAPLGNETGKEKEL